MHLISRKLSSSTLNNINLCDQLTSVSCFYMRNAQRKKTKHFNGIAGSGLPTNVFRISVSLLDMVEIPFEVIFLICCTHLNSEYEVTPQSPLD